jgi:hypothetical protein
MSTRAHREFPGPGAVRRRCYHPAVETKRPKVRRRNCSGTLTRNCTYGQLIGRIVRMMVVDIVSIPEGGI